MDTELEIIFEDESLIAINKPHGLMVHRSPLARDTEQFAVQLLRDQSGYRVYPVHRLDRKTSGVLLFAKTPEANRHYQQLFQSRQVQKSYLALVRGYLPEKGHIDYALDHEGKVQEAQTNYACLNQFEIPVPSHGFATSRYSLAELRPLTGRFHQLRKHMAHIFHPIIGDRPHGCNKQNRLWKERWGMTHMLLHASTLCFKGMDGSDLHLQAGLSPEFLRALEILETLHAGNPEGLP